MRGPGLTAGTTGNAVVVASSEPFDAESWDALRRDDSDGTGGGELVGDVDEYLAGAVLLTDEFAPVDQLIVGRR